MNIVMMRATTRPTKYPAAEPTLVYVQLEPGRRRVSGLRVAAPHDRQVTVYVRGRLRTLPADTVSRARPRSSASATYGRLLAGYLRLQALLADLNSRSFRRRAPVSTFYSNDNIRIDGFHKSTID